MSCNTSQPPTASTNRRYLLLLQSAISAAAGAAPVEPAFRHQPAGQRAVGQQPDAVLQAERAHLVRRAAVQQREADLVGEDRNPLAHQHPQMRGVEIGHAEMADHALLAQRREFGHRIEPGEVLEAPPMQLQQIDRGDAEAIQAAAHAGAHHLRRHRPRRGAPFGEHGRRRAARAGRRRARQKAAGDQLGAAVMVGHVEGVETGARVVEHGRGRRLDVERPGRALLVGHLPQAGDDAADLQIRGEADARRHGPHPGPLPGGEGAALAPGEGVSLTRAPRR